MAITKIKSSNIEDPLDLSSKTVTLPAASVTAHASPAPTLDSPVITGTLSVVDEGTVTHTVANYSADCSYTITPTNCTAGAVNASGQFVITHTSGTPSYTIKATTASLGLDDSALVTKNLTMQLTAPTLSSPADVGTATNVVYTITSTTAFDDKLVLDIGSSNFTYQSVSVGSASKVGNTVECTGFTTNNPAVTIQFTAEATYSVTAKSVKIDGSYGTSANSAADSIVIQNFSPVVATGGTTGTYTDDSVLYKFHTFTSTGTTNFVVTSIGSTPSIDILVIAGGGGGGAGLHNTSNGAGGGAGGLRWLTAQTPTASTYVATIGAGGSAATNADGGMGVNSSFIGSGISITGSGGAGGNKGGTATPRAGGSGAGANRVGHSDSVTVNGGAGNSGSYTPVEGYAGGSTNTQSGAGGGGGSGGTGGNNTTGGGYGGVGEDNFLNQSSAAFTVASTKLLLDAVSLGEVDGSSRHIAAGGGGAWSDSVVTTNQGGLGGGGNGALGANSTAATASLVNTGSGGGGGYHTSGQTGSAGSSGVVIVRYRAS